MAQKVWHLIAESGKAGPYILENFPIVLGVERIAIFV